MVKRRQQDLDAGSVLPKHSSASLRDAGVRKNQKKKSIAASFKDAARGLLSGGKVLRKPATKKEVQKIVEDTELFKLKTVDTMKRKMKNKKSKLADDPSSLVDNNFPRRRSKRLSESSSTTDLPISQKKKKPVTENVNICAKEIVSEKMASTKPTPLQKTLQGLASVPPTDIDTDGMQAVNEQHIWKTSNESCIIAFTVRIEICGTATITCLKGVCDIHGYRMTVGTTIDTYAPTGYNNTVVENTGQATAKFKIASIAESLPAIPALKSEIKQFVSSHPNCVLVKLVELSISHLKLCSEQLQPLHHHQCISKYKQPIRTAMVSDFWISPRYSAKCKQAVEYICQQVEQGRRVKVVICGAKNLGKSTLARYLLNRMLSIQQSVSHLECDPGQSEFTPSGCVSLHKQTTPLIGPPWCHCTMPDHLEYIGAISADVCPDHYITCIKRLVDQYEADNENGNNPMVVSTMGWHQGLGLQFLSAIVMAVKPTHVIQLCRENDSYKNFKEFSLFRVIDNNLFLTKDQQTEGYAKRLQYEVMPIQMYEMPQNWEPLKAVLSRELMMCAYLSQSLSRCHRDFLNAVTPYSIPWKNVAIDMSFDHVPSHLVLSAVNGSTVALCHIDKTCLISSDIDQPMTISKPGVKCMVLGFGMVRSLDMEKRSLNIVTPLKLDQLSQVNTLRKCHHVQLPQHSTLKQIGRISGLLPYFGERKTGAGYKISQNLRPRFKRRKGVPPTIL